MSSKNTIFIVCLSHCSHRLIKHCNKSNLKLFLSTHESTPQSIPREKKNEDLHGLDSEEVGREIGRKSGRKREDLEKIEGIFSNTTTLESRFIGQFRE